MMITKLALPRRTFLRGVGATLALPFLDAMVPAMSAMSRTAAAIGSYCMCPMVAGRRLESTKWMCPTRSPAVRMASATLVSSMCIWNRSASNTALWLMVLWLPSQLFVQKGGSEIVIMMTVLTHIL